jgi:4-hydroxybenzoate polyprenyltransferase
MAIKDWLQIGREHTSAIEIGVFLIIAYLAGVPPVLWVVYAVFGALYHYIGFGFNTLLDYDRYDRFDVNKTHHPLNRGAISVQAVSRTLSILMLIGIAYFFVLPVINYSRAPISLSVLIISFIMFGSGVIMGFAYDLFAKEDKRFAGFTISMSNTASAAGIYLVSGGTPDIQISLLLGWIFFYIAFQIWIGGEMKDIGNSHEKNILADMGATVRADGNVMFSSMSGILYVILMMGRLVTLSLVLYVSGTYYIAIGVLPVAIVYYARLLLPFKSRKKLLATLGAGEYITYASMAIAITAFPAYEALFAILPFIVFLSLNRYMWGTYVAPMV